MKKQMTKVALAIALVAMMSLSVFSLFTANAADSPEVALMIDDFNRTDIYDISDSDPITHISSRGVIEDNALKFSYPLTGSAAGKTPVHATGVDIDPPSVSYQYLVLKIKGANGGEGSALSLTNEYDITSSVRKPFTSLISSSGSAVPAITTDWQYIVIDIARSGLAYETSGVLKNFYVTLIADSNATGTIYIDEMYLSNDGSYVAPTTAQPTTQSTTQPTTQPEPVEPLDAPTLTLSGTTENSVSLSWNNVNNATGYNVYRSTNGANYTLLADVAGTTYTDNSVVAGNTYSYKVVAKNGTSQSFTVPAMDYVATNDADPKTDKTDGVYRQDTQQNDGHYNAGYIGDNDWARYIINAPVGGTYDVTLYLANGNAATLSAYLNDTANKNSPIAAFENVACAANQWQQYTAYTATINLNAGNNTIYFVAGSSLNFWKMEFTTDSSNQSGDSNVVTAEIARPEIPSVDLSKPTLTVSGTTDSAINLSWNAIDGATGYYVFRSEAQNGDFTKIATVNTTTYSDNTVEKNKAYYYQVQAYAGDGSSSGGSSESATCDIITIRFFAGDTQYVYDNNGAVSSAAATSTAAQWYKVPAGTNTYGQNVYYLKNVATNRYMHIADNRLGGNGDWFYYKTLTSATNAETDAYKWVIMENPGRAGSQVVINNANYGGGTTTTALNGGAYMLTNFNQENAGIYAESPAPAVNTGLTTDVSNNVYHTVYETAVSEGVANPDYAGSGGSSTSDPSNTVSGTISTVELALVSVGNVNATANTAIQFNITVKNNGTAAYAGGDSVAVTFKNATQYVTIPALAGGEQKVLTATATAPAANGTYDVTATYAGQTQTGTVTVTGGSTPDGYNIVTTVNGIDSISLSWDAVNGANGYYVFRGTNQNGPFEKIATVNTTSYTDTGLAPGTTYYYQVQSYATTTTASAEVFTIRAEQYGQASDNAYVYENANGNLHFKQYSGTPTVANNPEAFWYKDGAYLRNYGSGKYVALDPSAEVGANNGSGTYGTNARRVYVTDAAQNNDNFKWTIHDIECTGGSTDATNKNTTKLITLTSDRTRQWASGRQRVNDGQVAVATVTNADGGSCGRHWKVENHTQIAGDTVTTDGNKSNVVDAITNSADNAVIAVDSVANVSANAGAGFTATATIKNMGTTTQTEDFQVTFNVGGQTVTVDVTDDLGGGETKNITANLTAPTAADGATYTITVTTGDYSKTGTLTINAPKLTLVSVGDVNATANGAIQFNVTVKNDGHAAYAGGDTVTVTFNGNTQNITVPALTAGAQTVLTATATAPSENGNYDVTATLNGNSVTGTVTVTGGVTPDGYNVVANANGIDSVNLSWDAVNGASGYYVFRSTNANGPFDKIATVNTTSYTDEGLDPATTYYYQIQSYTSTTPAPIEIFTIRTETYSSNDVPAASNNAYVYENANGNLYFKQYSGTPTPAANPEAYWYKDGDYLRNYGSGKYVALGSETVSKNSDSGSYDNTPNNVYVTDTAQNNDNFKWNIRSITCTSSGSETPRDTTKIISLLSNNQRQWASGRQKINGGQLAVSTVTSADGGSCGRHWKVENHQNITADPVINDGNKSNTAVVTTNTADMAIIAIDSVANVTANTGADFTATATIINKGTVTQTDTFQVTFTLGGQTVTVDVTDDIAGGATKTVTATLTAPTAEDQATFDITATSGTSSAKGTLTVNAPKLEIVSVDAPNATANSAFSVKATVKNVGHMDFTGTETVTFTYGANTQTATVTNLAANATIDVYASFVAGSMNGTFEVSANIGQSSAKDTFEITGGDEADTDPSAPTGPATGEAYYVIQSVQRNYFLYDDGGSYLRWNKTVTDWDVAKATDNMKWQLIEQGGKYVIKNLGTGRIISSDQMLYLGWDGSHYNAIDMINEPAVYNATNDLWSLNLVTQESATSSIYTVDNANLAAVDVGHMYWSTYLTGIADGGATITNPEGNIITSTQRDNGNNGATHRQFRFVKYDSTPADLTVNNVTVGSTQITLDETLTATATIKNNSDVDVTKDIVVKFIFNGKITRVTHKGGLKAGATADVTAELPANRVNLTGDVVTVTVNSDWAIGETDYTNNQATSSVVIVKQGVVVIDDFNRGTLSGISEDVMAYEAAKDATGTIDALENGVITLDTTGTGAELYIGRIIAESSYNMNNYLVFKIKGETAFADGITLANGYRDDLVAGDYKNIFEYNAAANSASSITDGYQLIILDLNQFALRLGSDGFPSDIFDLSMKFAADLGEITIDEIYLSEELPAQFPDLAITNLNANTSVVGSGINATLEAVVTNTEGSETVTGDITVRFTVTNKANNNATTYDVVIRDELTAGETLTFTKEIENVAVGAYTVTAEVFYNGDDRAPANNVATTEFSIADFKNVAVQRSTDYTSYRQFIDLYTTAEDPTSIQMVRFKGAYNTYEELVNAYATEYAENGNSFLNNPNWTATGTNAELLVLYKEYSILNVTNRTWSAEAKTYTDDNGVAYTECGYFSAIDDTDDNSAPVEYTVLMYSPEDDAYAVIPVTATNFDYKTPTVIGEVTTDATLGKLVKVTMTSGASGIASATYNTVYGGGAFVHPYEILAYDPAYTGATLTAALLGRDLNADPTILEAYIQVPANETSLWYALGVVSGSGNHNYYNVNIPYDYHEQISIYNNVRAHIDEDGTSYYPHTFFRFTALGGTTAKREIIDLTTLTLTDRQLQQTLAGVGPYWSYAKDITSSSLYYVAHNGKFIIRSTSTTGAVSIQQYDFTGDVCSVDYARPEFYSASTSVENGQSYITAYGYDVGKYLALYYVENGEKKYIYAANDEYDVDDTAATVTFGESLAGAAIPTVNAYNELELAKIKIPVTGGKTIQICAIDFGGRTNSTYVYVPEVKTYEISAVPTSYSASTTDGDGKTWYQNATVIFKQTNGTNANRQVINATALGLSEAEIEAIVNQENTAIWDTDVAETKNNTSFFTRENGVYIIRSESTKGDVALCTVTVDFIA